MENFSVIEVETQPTGYVDSKVLGYGNSEALQKRRAGECARRGKF